MNKALDRLTDGIEALAGSERWAEWLSVAAKFHRYSAANCMLIWYQRPDATQVAGYKAWQSMGRQVRKGEHGIAILAPHTYKVHEGQEGEESRLGFHTAYVFDIEQTDGDPLPSPVDELTGEDHRALRDTIIEALEQAGHPVSREDLPGSTNGGLFPDGRIVLDVANSIDQDAKTLLHEWGHAVLDKTGDPDLDELEAESVAYVVAQRFGLDSGGYSFGYVLGWGGEEAASRVKASADRIMTAASEIIAELEDAV